MYDLRKSGTFGYVAMGDGTASPACLAARRHSVNVTRARPSSTARGGHFSIRMQESLRNHNEFWGLIFVGATALARVRGHHNHGEL
jgi:hypothetical protein